VHIAGQLIESTEARRAEEFYQLRDMHFPDFRELGDAYRALGDDKAAKKAFRQSNPAIVEYWNWRAAWMEQNADVATYLEDNRPTSSSDSTGPQSTLSVSQWKSALGTPLYNLANDYINGDDLPLSVQAKLEKVGQSLGFTGDYKSIILEMYRSQEADTSRGRGYSGRGGRGYSSQGGNDNSVSSVSSPTINSTYDLGGKLDTIFKYIGTMERVDLSGQMDLDYLNDYYGETDPALKPYVLNMGKAFAAHPEDISRGTDYLRELLRQGIASQPLELDNPILDELDTETVKHLRALGEKLKQLYEGKSGFGSKAKSTPASTSTNSRPSYVGQDGYVYTLAEDGTYVADWQYTPEAINYFKKYRSFKGYRPPPAPHAKSLSGPYIPNEGYQPMLR